MPDTEKVRNKYDQSFLKKYEKSTVTSTSPESDKIKVRKYDPSSPPKDKYEKRTVKERKKYESTKQVQKKYENYTKCIRIDRLGGVPPPRIMQ